MTRLSVIICLHNMLREGPRTLLSATLPYQNGLTEGDFEVLVIDNGSTERLPAEYVATLPSYVRVIDVPNPKPSPAPALNWAARELAAGEIFLFAIDGARIFSNRLIATSLKAHDAFDDPFVYTVGWHLGPKIQRISTQEGYDQGVEDRLIAAAGWPNDPDSLWDISVLAGSSRAGFYGQLAESNAFSVTRRLFESVGGYDERFTSPGGGATNLELFARYVTRPNGCNVCLLSEGTFHQTHGGATTSGKIHQAAIAEEYRSIFGRDFAIPEYEAIRYGSIRARARHFARGGPKRGEPTKEPR